MTHGLQILPSSLKNSVIDGDYSVKVTSAEWDIEFKNNAGNGETFSNTVSNWPKKTQTPTNIRLLSSVGKELALFPCTITLQ